MAIPVGYDSENKTKKANALMKTDVPDRFLCFGCGQTREDNQFYRSTDTFNHMGIVPFCKICLEKIARRYNETTGEYRDVTIPSLCEALERADKPFFKSVWEDAWNDF